MALLKKTRVFLGQRPSGATKEPNALGAATSDQNALGAAANERNAPESKVSLKEMGP